MAASHPAAIAGVKSCAGMKGRAKGRVRRVGGVSWGLWGKQGGGREGGGKVERGGGGGGEGGGGGRRWGRAVNMYVAGSREP